MANKAEVLRVKHPSDDGTWVEFHGASARQLEVLRAYSLMAEKFISEGGQTAPWPVHLKYLERHHGDTVDRGL